MIVALDRLALLKQHPAALAARTPSLPMSPEQIFGAYRGLDGQPWPTPPFEGREEAGLVALGELENVRAIIEKSDRAGDLDIVALSRAPDEHATMSTGWKRLGYDLGYLESRWSHFSVLLNEVIFGGVPAIRDFAKVLNSNLLLDSAEDAARLLATRTLAGAAGEDIETVGDISIYAVFSPNGWAWPRS